MKVTSTEISDVLIIEPDVHVDSRGFFTESFNQRDFNTATGTNFNFVQDCCSRSKKGVLRGLHYQLDQPQGKLISVMRGSVFDVVVDIRRSSTTFGKSVSLELNEDSNRQIWMPPGLAHGFLVLSESADIFYKTTQYYSPKSECCIRWDDQDLAVSWPAVPSLQVSTKDAVGLSLHTSRFALDTS